MPLPDGARIKAWALWGYDADSGVDMTVELRRKLAVLPSSSTAVSTIVSSAASGSFGQLQTLDYPVDSFNQHLYFAWCIPFGADPGNFGLTGIELTSEP